MLTRVKEKWSTEEAHTTRLKWHNI